MVRIFNLYFSWKLLSRWILKVLQMENQALKMTISFLEFYFFLNKTYLFLLKNPLRINHKEFLFFKTFQKSVFLTWKWSGKLKKCFKHLNGHCSPFEWLLFTFEHLSWMFEGPTMVFYDLASFSIFSCNYLSKNFPIPNMHAYLEFDDFLPS